MAPPIALAFKYSPCLDSLVRRDAQKPEYSLQRLVVALRKMLAANEQHLARVEVTMLVLRRRVSLTAVGVPPAAEMGFDDAVRGTMRPDSLSPPSNGSLRPRVADPSEVGRSHAQTVDHPRRLQDAAGNAAYFAVLPSPNPKSR